jgi:hypothetical protein
MVAEEFVGLSNFFYRLCILNFYTICLFASSIYIIDMYVWPIDLYILYIYINKITSLLNYK